MASNIEFIEFISSQLEDLGYVRCRKMFGDYMIYLDEKPIILVCDNIAYIKRLPELSDLMSDAEELSYIYPKLPMTMVPGNCDGWTAEPAKKQISLAGQSILLSHGHLWLVKNTYAHAISEARSVNANILLFGHTHRPYCETLDDGLVVMNPGAAHRHYGIILLQDGTISASLHPTF